MYKERIVYNFMQLDKQQQIVVLTCLFFNYVDFNYRLYTSVDLAHKITLSLELNENFHPCKYRLATNYLQTQNITSFCRYTFCSFKASFNLKIVLNSGSFMSSDIALIFRAKLHKNELSFR